MKYVKTFENFNYDPTNEGLSEWWSNIKNKWATWKNKEAKAFAENVTKALDNASGKLKEAIDRAKEAYNNLKPNLKAGLKDWLAKWTLDNKTETPELSAAVSDMQTAKKKKGFFADNQSYQTSINESTESLAKKVLNWLGLNNEYLILMTVVVAVLAVIVASAAASFILGAMVFVGGIMACISWLVSRGSEATE